MKEEKAGIEYKSIDASVIIGYLFEEKFKDVLESETDNFIISTITLFEIKKIMLERKMSINEVKEKIEFIKSISSSVIVSEEIAEKAAQLSFDKKIPAADSIIYATALINNAELITADNDFRGLPNVTVLDKN